MIFKPKSREVYEYMFKCAWFDVVQYITNLPYIISRNIIITYYKLFHNIKVGGLSGTLIPFFSKGKYVDVLKKGNLVDIVAHKDYPDCKKGTIRLIPTHYNHGIAVEFINESGTIEWRTHIDYQMFYKMSHIGRQTLEESQVIENPITHEKKRFYYNTPDGGSIGYTAMKEADPKKMKNLYEHIIEPVHNVVMKEMEDEAKKMRQVELEIKRFISCVPKEYVESDAPMIIKEIWNAKINERLPESLKYLNNREWVYYITSICDSENDDLSTETIERVFKTITDTWNNDCWR